MDEFFGDLLHVVVCWACFAFERISDVADDRGRSRKGEGLAEGAASVALWIGGGVKEKAKEGRISLCTGR
ncbi:hypothetical protein [Streptomyces sp. NPDC049881]|uniref:hypothetical protein n=1 Tax=Streptomyces sp. NPDC049881 TaxID=3155778 RepID=UPI003419ED15